MGRRRARGRREESSFFKVLFGDFSERLQVPPAFVKRFLDEVPQTVSLYSPFGTCCVVRMAKESDGRVFFEEGWNRFVKDHSLESGEFLVFYRKYSRFHVDIYDKNSCRKTVDTTKQRASNRTRKPMEQGKNDGGKQDCGSVIDLTEEHTSEHDISDSVDSGRQEAPITKSTTQKRIARQLLERGRGFESKNPFFLFVMQPSYSRELRIPMSFSRTYVIEDQKITTFRVSGGRAWPVKYAVYREGIRKRAKFTRGWNRFVCDIHLAVGDTCAFELVNAARAIFRVTIFRKRKVNGDGCN